MRAQVSEVVILTQLTRKVHLTFSLLVPPSIMSVLVIIISIFILIPTLTIIFSFFSYSFQAAGFLSGLAIVWKAHSPIG